MGEYAHDVPACISAGVCKQDRSAGTIYAADTDRGQDSFREQWKFTEEGSRLLPSEGEPELSVSIADLGSFLCGMLGAGELPRLSSAGNPEAVLEKLEKIRVLDGIYINETV